MATTPDDPFEAELAQIDREIEGQRMNADRMKQYKLPCEDYENRAVVLAAQKAELEKERDEARVLAARTGLPLDAARASLRAARETTTGTDALKMDRKAYREHRTKVGLY